MARYAALDKPMAIRKRRLLDSLQAQQLFRDLDDEAAWIREKEPIIASTNRGNYNNPSVHFLRCSVKSLGEPKIFEVYNYI